MSLRPRPMLLLSSALATLALSAPAASVAVEQGAATTTTPAPAAETTSSTPTTGAPAPTATSTGETTPVTPPPAPAPTGAPAVTTTPQVQAQHAQGSTPGAPGGPASAHPKAGTEGNGGTKAGSTTTSTSGGTRAGRSAPSPSGLTPALPLALGASIFGVPSFFIESFRIPPFLLPIYQAAGTAYGIPWQVLAAINEVETDYGRNLNVSSAGAEGWMQFLPSSWAQYGVDANGDGFKDPYNPADAIFAAARYLRAAGGVTNLRAAVFSYNHSQAYVDSVMLRAQLLGGTPSELLGAVTGLTQARFPVHAAAHFSDGFASAPGRGSSPARTLVGTTIYSQAGAPVIAVQDGEVVQIGDSPSLGRFVSLRDAYHNTYVYAELGGVATLYPVLVPHGGSVAGAPSGQAGGAVESAPSGPATAGAQPRSSTTEGASASGLALGGAGLEPASAPASPAAGSATQPAPQTPAGTVRVFREGPNDVYLHPLRRGVQVIAGTVLGHVRADASAPHILFQIRPAGTGAPLIDPKPILDGWVALENTSTFRAKGAKPFAAAAPTIGQVLLESKRQLEPQVLRDAGIRMHRCERQEVETGRVDKRVLVTLEFLSLSGLKPTTSGLKCGASAPASAVSDAVDITAINGTPIAAHSGTGSVADIAVRRLLSMQGLSRPLRILTPMHYSGTAGTIAKQSARNDIQVAFSLPTGSVAHAASAFESTLTPNEWIKLIARLGQIPNPTVASGPSTAAIPDTPGATGASGKESGGGH